MGWGMLDSSLPPSQAAPSYIALFSLTPLPPEDKRLIRHLSPGIILYSLDFHSSCLESYHFEIHTAIYMNKIFSNS